MTTFDASILAFLNQFAGRSPIFDHFVFDVADSALLKGALFMAYFWYAWFRGDGDATARRRAIVTALVGAVVAAILARSLQLLLPLHERPLHDPTLHFVVPSGVDPETLSHWSSFPSDHAVLFFALAVAVGFQSRGLGLLAAVWTLVVICLPRVYLGYHFPSDVVAGAAIGSVTMLATRWAIGDSFVVGRVLRWEETNARAFYGTAFIVTYELAFLFYDVRSLGADGYRLFRSVVASLA
jgi:undecaprenyl-diphosphatase